MCGFIKTEENEKGTAHTPQFAHFPHALIDVHQLEIRVIARNGILTRQFYKRNGGVIRKFFTSRLNNNNQTVTE